MLAPWRVVLLQDKIGRREEHWNDYVREGVNHILSYDEILSGQHRAWLVKIVFLYECNHKRAEKKVRLKFRPISENAFVILKSLGFMS